MLILKKRIPMEKVQNSPFCEYFLATFDWTYINIIRWNIIDVE